MNNLPLIIDFLEDGEALGKAGIADQEVVEEAYNYCKNIIDGIKIN